MALSIKNSEADELARELSERTGESLTEAVVVSLRERLERVRSQRGPDLRGELGRLADDLAALPTLDDRPADEILGYDGHGLPS